MVRRGLTLVLLALGACATSEVAATDGAVDIDAADPDAPVDAAIDAIDACVPVAEICNGLDDDCDMMSDEDFAGLGDACMAGSGACVVSGHMVCDAAGTGVVCDARPGDGGTETCNGIDDDCDMMTDEGFGLGTACDGGDADACDEGMIVCAATGGGTACSDVSGDNVELCNGVDDDCRAGVDDGFNLGMPCDGADSDACVEGTIVCGTDGAATCSDATVSTVEVCNGLDDDCRGGADDGFALGGTCSAGIGACRRDGTYVCNAGGTGVVCNAVQGSATAETCGDGIDQDCNGADIACPTNDGPAGALDISAGGVFTADLTAARNDQDYSGSFCGSTGGRDLYYTFTLPAAEVVYLDTFGTSFDSVLRVFAGSCTALGALQSCFDDQCGVTQTQGALSLAAGTYCVVADQYSSSQTTGTFQLTFTRGGRPGTSIAAASGSVSGTTAGGVDLSDGSCRANTAPDVGYYFMVCPSVTRTVGASTCTGTAYDSVVYLRKAPGTADLGCSDDSAGCGDGLQSSFTGAGAAGPGLFWLIVDGYSSSSGPFTLTYTIN